MVERISQAISADDLKASLGFLNDGIQIPKHYNIPALGKAKIIVNDPDKSIKESIWGLLPNNSKTGNNMGNLINVRIGMLPTAPSFRIPIRSQRCLIPVDSFYAWHQKGNHRVPHRIFSEERPVMLIAGLWDVWKVAFTVYHSFSIIITKSNHRLREISRWVPVIFNTSDAAEMWLEQRSLTEVMTLLRGQHIPVLHTYRVSDSINSAKYDNKEVQRQDYFVPTLFD